MKIELKNKDRGIVILALNHSYYARMAYNLAASIRQPSNGFTNICLIHDGTLDSLYPAQQYLFNKREKMDGKEADNPFYCKLNLFDMSPFEETIYLDADMVWLPNKPPSQLFDELSKYDFAIANRGYLTDSDPYDWADQKTFKQEYKIRHLLSCSSEVIYFKKNEKVKELFESAKDFYNTNTIVNKTIGGHQPDEPAFSCAINKSKLKMLVPFTPSYWNKNNVNYKRPQDINKEFYLMSMGGKENPTYIRQHYDNLLKFYSGNISTSFYPHENKKDSRISRTYI
jgi:hypothetical protein